MPHGSPLDAEYYRSLCRASGIPEHHLWAVITQETGGCGFQPDGLPVILFEAHLFSRATAHRYDATHPGVSTPAWDRRSYGPRSAQHARLAEAAALDNVAALSSTSWGIGQILGVNWRRCSPAASVVDFCARAYRGENDQLQQMVSFICGDKVMVDALRSGEWATFARRYNGPGYKANAYDTKLARYASSNAYSKVDFTVRALQIRAMYAGHHPGAIDGIFGPATKAALDAAHLI